MSKSKYRIREIWEDNPYYKDSDVCFGSSIRKYLVEKRYLWFFWKIEKNSLYQFQDSFLRYEDAVREIQKRNGILLYIC